MIEDDAYRASSQFRYWSYTKESLVRIRQNTNDLASERVRAAFRRAQAAAKSTRNGTAEVKDESDANHPVASDDAVEIQTLTVDEELKIIEWGCQKIIDMGEAMSPRIPSSVVVSFLLAVGAIHSHLFTRRWARSHHGCYPKIRSPSACCELTTFLLL